MRTDKDESLLLSEKNMQKRELFAVSLRKQKKAKILAQRRQVLMERHFGMFQLSQSPFTHQNVRLELKELDKLIRGPAQC